MISQSKRGLLLTIGPARRLGPMAGTMLLGWLLAMAGCTAANEMNALKAVAEEMSQNIGALQVRLNTRIETGGGDVNEPVTGWILAIGYALVPVSFLGYLLAHRSRRFRSFKERIRGGGNPWPPLASNAALKTPHPGQAG